VIHRVSEASFSVVADGMSESTAKKADKRSLITDAAIEVFAERGFHQSRVSDIAQRAGVADGTIYLYFKNKEDLLLSIFEEKMDFLLAGLREALADTADPVERVRRFAIFHFRQVRDNRAVAEVLQIELRLSNKFLKEYRPEKLWAYLGVFGQIVREGQAAGAFRPELDPFLSMWAFFGALDEIAMQWVLSRKSDRFDLESAARQVADVFIRGMAVDPAHNPPNQPPQSP
jgi:TetR/AcrR family fatty acid metabolism transcriptional regulator